MDIWITVVEADGTHAERISAGSYAPDAYTVCRQALRASLTFIAPSWLDLAFDAAADVPPTGDLDDYRQAVEAVVFRVMRELHYMHTWPCSETVQ